MNPPTKKKSSLKKVRLQLPAQDEDLAKLRIGDVVYLDGIVYTAREGAYKRILDDGVEPPVDLPALGNVNFHCSPAASVKNGVPTVGAVTATASFRFAQWLERWFAKSHAKVIIGKGGMSSKDYKKFFVPNRAIYLTTVGYGTGALLGRGIKKVDVHWLDELGIAQAIWVLTVEKFGPFLVESDFEGRSLFEESNEKVNQNIDDLYEGLKQPAMARYGETTSRKDEVV